MKTQSKVNKGMLHIAKAVFRQWNFDYLKQMDETSSLFLFNPIVSEFLSSCTKFPTLLFVFVSKTQL